MHWLKSCVLDAPEISIRRAKARLILTGLLSVPAGDEREIGHLSDHSIDNLSNHSNVM